MNIRLSDLDVEARAHEFLAVQSRALHRRTDRTFALLMGLQWLGGIVAALVVSPRTWAGLDSQVHEHVWAAVVLGFLFGSLPVALALGRPGQVSTRHVIAVGQALMSALLIHLTGGRIETHFHIFGSLALLAFYRDWRVLLTFSGVVAADHILRGAYWPESIFGAHGAESWRWLEHAAWVVFEDLFLIVSCIHGQRDLREAAEREARLELSRSAVEERVVRPLAHSAQALKDAMRTLTLATGAQRETLGRQAQALHEAQVTAEEIRQTAQVASQQAQRVLSTTEDAGDVGATAESAISNSVGALADIRAQATEISERIQGLEAHTAQIAGIAQTVKDLADQSNVLALNAAIEAARVGEQGKGFAVVAREIRSLASQSVQATGQVRSAVDDTRQGIQDVVELARRGAERMGRGMEAIQVSGESLRTLSGMVRGSSDSVRQIAATVGQQAAGVAQLFTAVTDLTALMQATLDRVDATRGAAETLQAVTEQVNAVIETYQKQD
ncbi:chemotaxis protein [Myxococcaceae bacterium JPH2]|nr:chemotaxis protein [Myxococcaceae bacterium JPH2]